MGKTGLLIERRDARHNRNLVYLYSLLCEFRYSLTLYFIYVNKYV